MLGKIRLWMNKVWRNRQIRQTLATPNFRRLKNYADIIPDAIKCV